MSTIPKILHFIWVGDESLRPDACIDTWRLRNPDCDVLVWGNAELRDREWRLGALIRQIEELGGSYCSVADLMRWEILLDHGGFALDADSVCLRALPDDLFDCDLFAVWENEYVSPGLVANGYVGAKPGHPVIEALIDQLLDGRPALTRFSWSRMGKKLRPPWQTTGPRPFTDLLRSRADPTVSIFPSHFFIPVHHSGRRYEGQGPVYSCELFASTYSSDYEELCSGDPEALVQKAFQGLRNGR